MPVSHDDRLSMLRDDSATRGDVVAHWRSELAAAEEAEQAGGQRPWLARMRVRLYRFLLACYASGPWGARPHGTEDLAVRVADLEGQRRASCQQSYVSPAGWTHVRPPGKIAAVLKAVAGAQAPHVAGPLVDGIEPDSWVTLAAKSSHVDLQRLARILKNNRIERRVRELGDDSVLEVRACDRSAAAYWLAFASGELRTTFSRSTASLRIMEILFCGRVVGLIGIPVVALMLPLLSWWLLGRTPTAEQWGLLQAGMLIAGFLLAIGLSAAFKIWMTKWRDSLALGRSFKILRSGK
jgi:hypothetical protein